MCLSHSCLSRRQKAHFTPSTCPQTAIYFLFAHLVCFPLPPSFPFVFLASHLRCPSSFQPPYIPPTSRNLPSITLHCLPIPLRPPFSSASAPCASWVGLCWSPIAH